MSNVGHLTDEAVKRKERLKALRNKQNTDNESDHQPPEKKFAGDESLPK